MTPRTLSALLHPVLREPALGHWCALLAAKAPVSRYFLSLDLVSPLLALCPDPFFTVAPTAKRPCFPLPPHLVPEQTT